MDSNTKYVMTKVGEAAFNRLSGHTKNINELQAGIGFHEQLHLLIQKHGLPAGIIIGALCYFWKNGK